MRFTRKLGRGGESVKGRAADPNPNVEAQLTAFIEKFDPSAAECIRACRAVLRSMLPAATELIYDNYNFFVIGYSATDRPSDSIVSLAAASNGVSLSFYRGASLPDPNGLLLGSGKQNRFVRLPAVQVLTQPPIQALINAAVAQAKVPLARSGVGHTVIRSVSAKQRTRRKRVGSDA